MHTPIDLQYLNFHCTLLYRFVLSQSNLYRLALPLCLLETFHAEKGNKRIFGCWLLKACTPPYRLHVPVSCLQLVIDILRTFAQETSLLLMDSTCADAVLLQCCYGNK